MYEPDRKSRGYLYVLLAFAGMIAYAMVVYLNPLIVQASCSETAQKSAGLVKRGFLEDPYSSYDYNTAKCLTDVFGDKN